MFVVVVVAVVVVVVVVVVAVVVVVVVVVWVVVVVDRPKDAKLGINNTFLANFSAVCLLTVRGTSRPIPRQWGLLDFARPSAHTEVPYRGESYV